MSSGVVRARVLLIEDDVPLATIISKHLKARGHEARVAASAEEATRIVRAGYRPTIVLLDINLPGESGWSFLRSGALDAAASRRSSWSAPPPSRPRDSASSTARATCPSHSPFPLSWRSWNATTVRRTAPKPPPPREGSMLSDLALIALMAAWLLGFMG